ncbi:MAG: hypothetical protein DSM106950_05670 [Stigonema ocellatum SAG 48.90 = DSM 106950]|nr:hypothetical protein [Stigonema ocellatum SAG 48.90 = DSM 106950]
MVNNELDDAQNNQDNSPDNAQKLDTEGDNFALISIGQLMQKYDIRKAPLYKRIKYLKITTRKVSSKAYLDAEQVVHMDGLHLHIKEHGKMDGYPVPPLSEPIDEPEEESSIVVAQSQQIVPSYSPKQKRKGTKKEVDDTPSIVKSAQNKATATLIVENFLAQKFIENPELLPEELKQKIKESAEVPVIDPFAYVESLMASISIEEIVG